jgi:pimeloyl-ACP methyl ester carboxylesterase
MTWKSGRYATVASILAGVCLALLGAGCGGAEVGGSSAAGSESPSPAVSPSPVANVVQAAPVKHVAVGDLSVGYRVIGPLAATSGEDTEATGAEMPLLLIMGSSGTMDMWSPAFVAALAQDRPVIVFDNRGLGETDNPAGAYPFPQLADDTAGLIKALGYDRLDVLGWSMGGEVAIDLAVRHPAVVGRLVSYAGDPGGRLTIPPTKEAMAVLMDTSGSPQKRGERLIELLFPAAYRGAHPAYAEAFPIPTEQADPAAIDLQNKAIGEWSGVGRALKDIACPTLFVTGTEDVISPPGNALMMALRVPGSWLMRFAGAGHGLMYQDPQGLAQAVLLFFAVTATTAEDGG